MTTLKKGFTLIEILIIIAVLSALATGLVAAINPVEQIRRANDAATHKTLNDINSSFQEYGTRTQALPWCANNCPPGGGQCTFGCQVILTDNWVINPPGTRPVITRLDQLIDDFNGQDIFDKLSAEGDLKNNYRNENLNVVSRIYINDFNIWSEPNRNYYLCFQPESEIWQHKQETNKSPGGAVWNPTPPEPKCKSDPSGTGTINCYWCLKDDNKF